MKQIVWTKLSFEDEKNKLVEPEDDEDDFEAVEGGKMPMIIQQSSPFIMSLVGPISLESNHNITDYYDLWVMDVNFKLTEQLCEQIAHFDGIEVFNPVSPYKAVVGIGKLFHPTEVKVSLEHALTGKHAHYIVLSQIENAQVRNESLSIYNKCKKYDHWLMYIFPNGSIEHFCTSDIADYEQKFQELSDCQELSQGMLLYDSKPRTH